MMFALLFCSCSLSCSTLFLMPLLHPLFLCLLLLFSLLIFTTHCISSLFPRLYSCIFILLLTLFYISMLFLFSILFKHRRIDGSNILLSHTILRCSTLMNSLASTGASCFSLPLHACPLVVGFGYFTQSPDKPLPQIYI